MADDISLAGLDDRGLSEAAREEVLRAADRRRIGLVRAQGRWLRLLVLLCGPGLLVMLGENDGPSMLSYAATGAGYGIGFFVPFILLTFVMAYVVQEMAMRLGVASGCGHAGLIFQRFGPFWGYFAMGDLVLGNVLTLVTEFIAIQAGAAYFGVPPLVAVGAGVALVLAGLALRRYATWERALLVLAAGNLLFVPAAFFAHPDFGAIGRAVVSWGPLPGGADDGFILLLLANIGATVTPWMIFFQQSTVVDKGLTRADIPQGRADTALGALVAAIAGVAALVACVPLHAAHVDASGFASGADFATALRPFIGHFGAGLFALGMMEAGLLAAMTVSASSAYALAEVFSARHSLNLDFRGGKLFYGTSVVSTLIAAGIVLIPHAPLLAMTLTVNVIATLLMAPALLLLLLLANDEEVMAGLGNGRLANAAGGVIVVGIACAGAAYGVITVFPAL